MTPIVNELLGYEEYVKDYEEKRADLSTCPLDEDEILERTSEICEETEVSREEEATAGFAQVMLEGNSADGQQHKFIFEISMKGFGSVTVKYMGVN